MCYDWGAASAGTEQVFYGGFDSSDDRKPRKNVLTTGYDTKIGGFVRFPGDNAEL
jgi:hypothetical protein